MRRTVCMGLALLALSFFSIAPAGADSITYFEIESSSNVGTISYAGGNASLIGTDIPVFNITNHIQGGGVPADLTCVQCKLSFTTGNFAGVAPVFPFVGQQPGYLFSGGGSLQIIGGINFQNATPLLPLGTTLLAGLPTTGLVGPDLVRGTGVAIGYGGQLHPTLQSYYGRLSGVFSGSILVNTAEAVSAPDAFTLTTILNQAGFGSGGENSFAYLTSSRPEAVPIPETSWMLALGFGALVLWRECRKVST